MTEITVEELKARIDNGEKLNIVDVREPWEYEEFNIGAMNYPLSGFSAFLPELEHLKEAELFVHCKMGGRSAQAVAYLEQMGFKKVLNVKGGMDEWKLKFT